jgi:hypothetical protein
MSGYESGDGRDVEYVGVIEDGGIGTQGEADGEQGRHLVLDAIPVSVLNRLATQSAVRRDDAGGIDFLLLTLQKPPLAGVDAAAAGGYVSVTVSQRQPRDGEILARPTGINGIDNNNLPYSVRINGAPSRRHVQTLAALSRFAGVPDAEDFSGFTEAVRSAEAIAVYDPLMFFDLGWPASFNLKSAPPTKEHFDPFVRAPKGQPVVLSHLDWDHWAFACESGHARWDKAIGGWKTEPVYRNAALDRPWLLQRPRLKQHDLGPSHIHFVDELRQRSMLRFWPANRRRIDIGSATLFACRPPKSTNKRAPAYLRNNQGLGMVISDEASGARILLPGDADYPSIPAYAKKRLTGMVATHHGGKVTPGSVPDAACHGRMAMSVSEGSYSGIPHDDTTAEALGKGWDIFRTDDRKACHRDRKQWTCGNQMIRLRSTPMCGCGGIPEGCGCISRTAPVRVHR